MTSAGTIVAIVVPITKLQHRNLVSLLGFCLQGEKKILAYEYVHNQGLHYILFARFIFLNYVILCMPALILF